MNDSVFEKSLRGKYKPSCKTTFKRAVILRRGSAEESRTNLYLQHSRFFGLSKKTTFALRMTSLLGFCETVPELMNGGCLSGGNTPIVPSF